MRFTVLVVSFCLGISKLIPAEAQAQAFDNKISVVVKNYSSTVKCAEDDNVYLPFQSPQLHSFRIEVEHPVYIEKVAEDRTAPDWASCDMSDDPAIKQEPRQVTFYWTPELWLVGYTHPTIWQANPVPFRVGDRVEEQFDLVQLWVASDTGPEEVLVVYPQDGYWRARPLPPDHLGENAYGSSFLVGPVEVGARPYVTLSEIAFEPENRAFRLKFARGGSAVLRLDSIDHQRMAMDVSFDGRLPTDKPFAALRSMYIAESNADAARIAWTAPGYSGWNRAPVMAFAGASVGELWLGRTAPSQHNLSAPDIRFGDFRADGLRRRFMAQIGDPRDLSPHP